MKSSLRRLGRILPWLQTGWSILGVTLVMVVLLELGLRGVFLIKDRWKSQIPPRSARGLGSPRWRGLAATSLSRT
ncbi:MAG: hypothetical protein ACXWNX_16210 [Isosphaeraceae bacterium]